jgi:molybdate transport system substrate-binding protein
MLICLGFTGCSKNNDSSKPKHTELLFYCGAGLRDAAKLIQTEFELKNPDIKLALTYAGSGRLLGQLGASQLGDLFMPGSAYYIDQAINKGWADKNTRCNLAFFVPVIMVQKGNPHKITCLKQLTQPNIRIGLGDERAVAVGKRSYEIFQKNNLDIETITKNLVYKSATVNELGLAIQLKNVDAVIMWDANARQFAKYGDIITIPIKQNIISCIPIAVLTFSQHPSAAKRLIDFISSNAGINLFRKANYTTKIPKGVNQ